MSNLENLEAAIMRVRQSAHEKADRTPMVNEHLRGKVDVGDRAHPNREAIALLNRRALFVTKLREMGVWS